MGPVEFSVINVAVVTRKLGNLYFWRENTGRTSLYPPYRQIDIPGRAPQPLRVKTGCGINNLPG